VSPANKNRVFGFKSTREYAALSLKIQKGLYMERGVVGSPETAVVCLEEDMKIQLYLSR